MVEEPQSLFAKTLFPHLPSLKWAAALFGVTGALTLALNIPISGWAFVVFLFSSTLWIISSILMKERSIMMESSVYTVINIIGIYRWLF